MSNAGGFDGVDSTVAGDGDRRYDVSAPRTDSVVAILQTSPCIPMMPFSVFLCMAVTSTPVLGRVCGYHRVSPSGSFRDRTRDAITGPRFV